MSVSSTPPEPVIRLGKKRRTSLLHRQAAEMIRRQEWLAAVAPDEAQEQAPLPVRASAADKYGINMDDFRMKTNRRPRDFKKALRIAGWTAE